MKIISWNMQGATGKYTTVARWINTDGVSWITLQECGEPDLPGLTPHTWRAVTPTGLYDHESLREARVPRPANSKTRGMRSYLILHWSFTDAGNNRVSMAIICCGELAERENFEYSVLHMYGGRRRPAIGLRVESSRHAEWKPWVYCVHLIANQNLARKDGASLLAGARRKHERDAMVFVGDWNCDPSALDAPRGFTKATARGASHYSSGSGARSHLDYGVSFGADVRAASQQPDWSASDHQPIALEVGEMEAIGEPPRKKKRGR